MERMEGPFLNSSTIFLKPSVALVPRMMSRLVLLKEYFLKKSWLTSMRSS